VYVRPFPGPGGRWQVSTGGGSFPLWARDGRELLFQALDERVMAVGYTAKGDSFAAGKPRVWSGKQLANIGLNPNYDPAPDGKRIAALARRFHRVPTYGYIAPARAGTSLTRAATFARATTSGPATGC
jgi:hypothetical protein